MLDLTVIILTKNEEHNLEKCMRSLEKIAKRIVVVDSFSTDGPVALAKRLGADVYQNPWVDYATQLNWGLEHTDINTKWTMRMDADEELLPELVEEILTVLPNLDESVKGIELRRRVYFMGRWIRHGGVYPTIMLRIFRTGFCKCEQTIMDEHMILTEGTTICLKNDFIDYNTKSLEWWIGKHNWYSDREVMDYLDKQRQLESGEVVKPKLFGSQAERRRWLKYMVYYKTPLMRRAHWYFIYRYIFRGGFLDGPQGLAFHFLQGYWYRFLVDAKIFENRIKESK
ncbi:MAG: glycosyltransferase family 2 protein [bacterium]|nr:glycosyltransferase family 2 protein [bacterium]